MMDRVAIARKLRCDQTRPEELVWAALRRGQLEQQHFRLQHPIGPNIVDFVCRMDGLVVEIDGLAHDQTLAVDEHRTEFLETKGFRALRLPNQDVRDNLEAVGETIRLELNSVKDGQV